MADLWKLFVAPVKTPTETLVAGTIDFYEPGTTGESNRKDVYTDAAGTIVAANPYTLDSDAIATLYGTGLYHVVIKDADGNTEYDYDYISPTDFIGVFPVLNLTALKAITGYSGAQASTTYRSTLGDGGGGDFYWNGGDLSTEVTADTQFGIYVPPNSDVTGASGAWVRHHSDIVNVNWYGVTGDGATDDTTALQAAIDAADSASLPVILNTAEKYLVSATIDIPDGVSVLGLTGTRSNLKVTQVAFDKLDTLPAIVADSGFTGNVVEFIDAFEAVLANVLIDASGQSSGNGVVVKEHSDGTTKAAGGIVIENVVVYEPYADGFDTEANLGTIKFEDCTTYRSRAGNGYDIKSVDAKMYNSNGFKNFLSGLKVTGANVRVYHSDFFHNLTGISANGLTGIYVRTQTDENLGHGYSVGANFNRFYDVYSYRSNAQAADVPTDVTASVSAQGTFDDFHIATGVTRLYVNGGLIGDITGGTTDGRYGVYKEDAAALGSTNSVKFIGVHSNCSYQTAFANDNALADIKWIGTTNQDIEIARVPKQITSGTTVDARWGPVIEYAPSVATILTDIQNGEIGQTVEVIFTNADATVNVDGNLNAGSFTGNQAMPQYSVMTAYCVDGTNWIVESDFFA